MTRSAVAHLLSIVASSGLIAAASGCGGATAGDRAEVASTPMAAGGESGGAAARRVGSGGANQQGRRVAGSSGASSTPFASAAPTQADVLGRSGYGAGAAGGAGGPGGAFPASPGGAGPIGGDHDHPVPTCGAMESYLYVARDFQCPGGGNPLASDPRAASEARVGSVGAHPHTGGGDPLLESHIVDQYRVPCPTGPIDLFVCLYHCPVGRTPID
jgi:hypothetical protein